MTSKAPAVPRANQSPKGTGDPKTPPLNDATAGESDSRAAQKGRQANIRQNTTNQGYQQDR